MPIETFSYLDSLDASNPPTSDGLVQGDDHIRGIKSTLKSTFPGLVGASTRVIDAAWGFLSGDGNSSAPALAFTSEPTLGLYRSSAGVMTAKGVLRVSAEVGEIRMFGMAAPPAGWLVCDGQTLSRTTYADLFNAISTTWGNGDGSGTTFSAPNFVSRFPRHRDNATLSGAVGNRQNPANLSHTHNVSGTTATESVAHSHTFSGTTSFMTANQNHSHTYNNSNGASSGVTGGGSFGLPINDVTANTGSANTDHQHTYSGVTATESVNHSHTLNITSGTGTADDANEARPYAATVLFCIRF